ncbi:hypothetical protein ANCCEY_06852 [Ancylostoma ceylanicum]|uniref:Uncharacterized protein n=2 Tax=Ancylostoma ceylanicum TaxID=53326 RepID=A0A0D6LPT9_9BILA|nr:hypothetical protein ANCCEY_06852 [Ancylostoma ceylanicum]EYC45222.1 hypothetical protein Y032_0435g1413 [Ancylostoma ceylanicum]
MKAIAIISFSAVVTLVTANICNDGTGTWIHDISEGVTDFAYGGVPINKKYNCFEGCLATGTVAQNFKVALNASGVAVKERNFGGKAERLVTYMKMKGEGADRNAHTCIDPALRADIQNALEKVVDHSCKGVVRTLLFNLNRPGWVVNCVDYTDISIGSFVEDVNFCAYLGVVSPYTYDIRLAKIDIS